MPTGLPAIAVCILMWLPIVAEGQSGVDIKQVSSVYVGSLGSKPYSETIKKDLTAELRKSALVTIVSSPGQADAVLSGEGELWVRGYFSLNPRSGILPQNGTPVYGGSLSVQLDGKDSDTLWSYLVTPHFGSTSISKDMCKELVRRFAAALRDAGRDATSGSHRP